MEYFIVEAIFLRLAIRSGIQDQDPDVAAAAVRALCDTIDPDLIEDITGLARYTQDEKYRGLAVAAGVRLPTQEETVKISTAQRVASLRLLLAAAGRREEKRLVLAGWEKCPTWTRCTPWSRCSQIRIFKPRLPERR